MNVLAPSHPRLSPDQAFVSQFKNPSNPMGGDYDNADCGVVSSLMAMWMTGTAERPTTPTGINDAIVGARLIATGDTDRTKGVGFSEIAHLLTTDGAPFAFERNGTRLLDDVRRGAVVIAFGTGTAVDDAGTGTWYQRRDELHLPIVPGGHAVAIGGYSASDRTYTVLDPTGDAPIHVTRDELRTFIGGGTSQGWPAGVVVGS